ncbi:MAG: adenylate/guanylate cyclase domain-containing protein [Azospirillaceae bacterium]
MTGGVAPVDFAALADALVRGALRATGPDALCAELGRAAVDAGLPVLRLHLSVTLLHPQFASVSATWMRGAGSGAEIEPHDYGSRDRRPFLASPIHYFLTEVLPARVAAAGGVANMPVDRAEPLRFRLEAGEGCARFEVLSEFRAAGATDYLLFGTTYTADAPEGLARDDDPGARGMIASWTTDRPGGFTEAEVAGLSRVQPLFAAALRTGIERHIAATVLETYLGPDAGRRVLGGHIRRGSVEAIDAAILVADLRGFTTLADRLDRDALIGLLNADLAAIVAAVEAEGGQVLKFLGDGLLATFALDPVADGGAESSGAPDRAAVCARALAAASGASAAVAALDAERAASGGPTAGLDVALHLGTVAYGNVGSESRLDFTVIGPAVNEASRIEALCAEIGAPILASRAFVEAAGTPGLFRSVGEHRLRGVAAPRELFAVVES